PPPPPAERPPGPRGGPPQFGGAVADVAVDDDQRRSLGFLPEDLESAGEQREVVGVADPGDVPAVAGEPGGDVVRVGDLRWAVDRDVVVVVDPAEVVE